MVLSSQRGHGAGRREYASVPGTFRPLTPHLKLQGGRAQSYEHTRERGHHPPDNPSPDIHLMRAEAKVGVKYKAGGQVIVLAQFPGCHSVRPHGALKTMLLLAHNRAQGCALCHSATV